MFPDECEAAETAKGEVREDGFLDGALSVLQPARGERVGIDPVFLAASVAARTGERILDVGAGVGVASLCLAKRLPQTRICGVEIQPRLAELFAANIRRNDCAERLRAVSEDVLAPMERLREKGLAAAAFDHVLTNPPFFAPGERTPPSESERARAHINPVGLDRWLGRCCAFLRPGGVLSVIYPSVRLGELLAATEKRCGGMRLFFLWSGTERPASRVICRGRLGSRAPLRILPGMILHEADGGYTPHAQAVLRGGGAIRLGDGD